MLALSQAGLACRLALPAASSGLGLLALSPALLRTLSTFQEPSDQQQQAKDKRYVDRLKITARGGKGGNGCTSFYQEASRGELRRLLDLHAGAQRWGRSAAAAAAAGACWLACAVSLPIIQLQAGMPLLMAAAAGTAAAWSSEQSPSEQQLWLIVGERRSRATARMCIALHPSCLLLLPAECSALPI